MGDFTWRRVPPPLARDLAEHLGLGRRSVLEKLESAFPDGPNEDFVKQAWPVLLERWATRNPAVREHLSQRLHAKGLGDPSRLGTSAASRNAFLRSCRNASGLRRVVLTEFLACFADSPTAVASAHRGPARDRRHTEHTASLDVTPSGAGPAPSPRRPEPVRPARVAPSAASATTDPAPGTAGQPWRPASPAANGNGTAPTFAGFRPGAPQGPPMHPLPPGGGPRRDFPAPRQRAARPNAWHHPAVVLVLLVLLFPVGLVLLWTKKDWSLRVRSWLTAATALWAALILTVPTGGGVPSASETDSPPSPAPSLTVPSSAPTTSPTTSPTPSATPTSADPRPGSALAALSSLTVKGRAPLTGYARALFGEGWVDTNRNGCDTRNDILRRDLTRVSLKAGTNGCVVLTGHLAPEPYTGAAIRFQGGGTNQIEIDHVVALADAWQKGAAAWPPTKRIAFANDPLNLLAVSTAANRQKSEADAASWLPASQSYRCDYVARQVGVKAKYGLWVTLAERAAAERVLSACPTIPPATGGLPTTSPVGTPPKAPRSTPTPIKPQTTPPKSSPLDPQFRTCAAAKKAGYGPYIKGQDPEYEWYRDADHDNVVCE